MSCYFLEATAFAKLFVQEPGTDALIRLMEAVEDNRKLISASTPLEVYAAIRRRERAGDIAAEDAAAALEILRLEAARMVQQPLNPGVLEAARQLLDRTTLRWPDTLQLAPRSSPAICFPAPESSSSLPRRPCSMPQKRRASNLLIQPTSSRRACPQPVLKPQRKPPGKLCRLAPAAAVRIKRVRARRV